jgi:dienelactone hydrolase
MSGARGGRIGHSGPRPRSCDRRGHSGAANVEVSDKGSVLTRTDADGGWRGVVISNVDPVTKAETRMKETPVTLAGDVRLPKANEKNPVVILFHSGGGQGGATDAVADWVRILNEAGIATFTIDSFTPRGILSLADVGRPNSLLRVIDAYRALVLLSKHRLIDPDRIVVMGGSHVGTPALYSSLTRFQKLHGNPDLRFAAHIVFYGTCATTYRDDELLTQRPLLVLHGTADNAVSAAACRDYTARLAKAGANVRFIEYPDAQHRFDSPNLQQPVNLPQAPSPVACRYAEIDAARSLTWQRNSRLRRTMLA